MWDLMNEPDDPVKWNDATRAYLKAALPFVRQIDKLPLPVKSAPGFLVNRVLFPYLHEALHAVALELGMLFTPYAAVFQIASAGKIPVILGGDHTVAMPDITGLAEHFGYGRISVVHFDAHADTGDIQFGSLYGHGLPMRRVIESGAVRGDHWVEKVILCNLDSFKSAAGEPHR